VTDRKQQPHKQQPVENWWTPGRVRRLLSVYPQLKEAAYLDCRIDAPDGDSGTNVGSSRQPRLLPRTLDCAMMKADLDMAIARLPMHLRMVALVYWVRGYSDAEAVGRMLRLSTRQIFRHLNQARERMVSHLCENQCQ